MFDTDKFFSIKQSMGLKSPVKLIISEKVNKSADAFYQPVFNNKGQFTSHKITVYINNPNMRSIDSLIAHELIHAWQQENNNNEMHGRRFRKWAKYITNEYQIFDVYIRGIDKK